jgi:RAB protein geranylgeranyltransferase component A
MDRNDYYGGASASLNLTQVSESSLARMVAQRTQARMVAQRTAMIFVKRVRRRQERGTGDWDVRVGLGGGGVHG